MPRYRFDVVAPGTGVEGAELVNREFAGRWRCRDCGREFALATVYDGCSCDSRRLEHLAGEEPRVKSIEVEEAA